MWNWKPNSKEPVKPYQTYLQQHLKENQAALDRPSNYNLLNVKKEFQGIKEKHPYFQQLHKPHQKAIPLSYLPQTQPRREVPFTPCALGKVCDLI